MDIIKKMTALLAAFLIAAGCSAPVLAEPTAAPADATQSAETNGAGQPESAGNSPQTDTGVYIEDPEMTAPNTEHAGAALLMEMKTGRTLYSKNADAKMYPASTTKMMTAIIALESGRMTEIATATYEALQSITLEDSHMGILVGETLSMTDLLNGMLIYSANDAANVIAVQLAGSMDAFVDIMNAKAQELGMTSTHFQNPCGVHNDDHYTTANDLATLARYCMRNETFRSIVAQPSYHIAPTNKYGIDRYLPTTNLFLSTARSSYYLYKPCNGIKTGTTEAAGHCLVASAQHKDMELLAITLKCDDEDMKTKAYSYNVARNLFDFGFNNYETKSIISAGNIVTDSRVSEAKDDKRVTLTVDADISALVPNGGDISGSINVITDIPQNLTAPIAKGSVVGTVTYMYNNTALGSANLIASNDVELDMLKHIFFKILKVVTSPLFFIPVIVLIIIALIAKASKQRKERKKRLQQIRQRREAEEARKIGTTDRISRNVERNRASGKGGTSRYYDERNNDKR